MALIPFRKIALYTRLNPKFIFSKIHKSTCGRSKDDDEVQKPDAPLIPTREVLALPEELEHERRLRYENVDTPKNESLTSNNFIPKELQDSRTARIYKEAKNCMQSGTFSSRYWKIMFDTKVRWESPNMGWTSTGDPISNVKLNFQSLAAAVRHCEKNGWDYYIDKPRQICFKVRTYAANYSWNKRYRVSTK